MSLKSRSYLLLVLPVLALSLVTACGAAQPPTASPAPTAVQTPYHVNVPASLVGTTWEANIQDSQVSAGLWTLEFTNNEILATNPHEGAESFPVGITNITGDHIDFFTERDCQAGDPQPDATYTYAVVNNQLTFTPIQDKCRDRKALLTALPWDLQL